MIDLSRESPLPLSDVPALCGTKRPHISAVYRWSQRGCKGIVLETIQVGGTRCTTVEAFQRFCNRLTQRAGNTEAPATTAARKRASDKAAAALEKAGW